MIDLVLCLAQTTSPRSPCTTQFMYKVVVLGYWEYHHYSTRNLVSMTLGVLNPPYRANPGPAPLDYGFRADTGNHVKLRTLWIGASFDCSTRSVLLSASLSFRSRLTPVPSQTLRAFVTPKFFPSR